ncbi:hypothetical protein An01g09340 [Aspergillus niger]|uniref:Uncharacterized protein n=2 Tax=Aspergillus niger TaxID=5061 RepID=A2Q9W5_ASPNC|nr:hypothetical protein An01g09340 [Aspergillus niger]CAK43984.1 hypothetical protein An01g09340 [Aspergillus niger]
MAVISAPDLALIGALPSTRNGKGNTLNLRMHMVHDITGAQLLRLESINDMAYSLQSRVALTIALSTVFSDDKVDKSKGTTMGSSLNSTRSVAIHIDSTSAVSKSISKQQLWTTKPSIQPSGYAPARPAGSVACPTSEPEPTS